MKKLYLYLIIPMFFSACSPREPFFDFNAETFFTINLGLSILETHNFIKSDIIVPLESSITNLGVAREDVTEVLPFACRLVPRFGDEISLEFINAVNVYIIDPESLRRREIFYLDFVPLGDRTEIQLLPSLQDISTGLLQNDRAIIEVSVELRQFPPSTFDIEVLMNFAGYIAE